MRKLLLLTFAAIAVCCSSLHAERVPAATAYLDPDAGGVRVSAEQGVTRWNDPGVTVTWFGELKRAGKLQAGLVLRVETGKTSRLRLTIAGHSREVAVEGRGNDAVTADFGEYPINEAGYHAFKLESMNPAGEPAGDIEALVLDGAASGAAHFNLKPRRNAASVHLAYPVPRDVDVSAFYCEMTGVEEPLWTYYMAGGWHRGYFGMQVNSATERRIIFSVWDSGGEAVDRNKVAAEDRVVLVDKGEGVYAGSFGNEGTGGHSHLKFPWQTGQRQRFLVTAEPVDETHTVFAGYYFRPDQGEWMLISSWKAPQEGKYLRGLYSFSENFVGRNGHVLRKARYGNQWIRTADGPWSELTTASFSHDPTGKEDRLDRFMGVEDGDFFLSHGGFIAGSTMFGTRFTRPSTGRSPATMDLPPLPKPRTKS
ncbi:MAG: DUF3472 domain-containing protein [Planctomycetota bacterium]|nr:DUF3472 domain-containing protein [Planctomycetota bacterium]